MSRPSSGRAAPRAVIGWPEWLLFIVVLPAAAWLRFAHLQARGLLLFDEGVYVSGGQFACDAWQAWLHHGWGALQAYLRDPGRWMGMPSPFAKPLHDVTLALAMLVGGSSPLSALCAMAGLSLLTVAVVFAIGRRCFDAWTGLIAASLLAVSGYQLAYARSALAEASAMWWCVCAVWWLAPTMAGASARPPSRRRLVAAGACAGLAFLCNYRLWMVPLGLLLMDRLQKPHAPRAARGDRWRRAAWLLAGGVLPLLLWIAAETWCLRGAAPALVPYARQLVQRYGKHLGDGYDAGGVWAYAVTLRFFDGAVCTALYGAGVAWALIGRHRLARALALTSLLVIGFFSVFRTHHARYISVALPLMVLCAAWLLAVAVRGVALVLRVGASSSAVLAALSLAILLWRAPAAAAWTRLTTGYVDALETMRQLSGEPVPAFVSTQPFVFSALAGQRARPLPRTDAAWREAARAGVRFLVVDYQLEFGGVSGGGYEMARTLVARRRPVAIVLNPGGASPQVEFEHVSDLALTRRRLRNPALRGFMGTIAIYDVRSLAEVGG